LYYLAYARTAIEKLQAVVDNKAEKDELISTKRILKHFEAKLNELCQKDYMVNSMFSLMRKWQFQ